MTQKTSHAESGDIFSTMLFVDLDGTLTPTDTLHEALLQVIKRSPINIFKLVWFLLKGRASLKAFVAQGSQIVAKYLPYNEELISYLRKQKENGRRIVLATAAHESIAKAVSAHLGLFSDVLATQGAENLKGKTKLKAIRQYAGDDFVYAGDSSADLPIWMAAKASILVGVKPSVEAQIAAAGLPVERHFRTPRAKIDVWLRALRVHQWLKNSLLFVPLLTAFSFMESGKLATTCLAFLAFSLAASATYIVNDLWDLSNDRMHPRKCTRPFASASLSIPQGLFVAAVALIFGLALAWTVSAGFLFVLMLYLVLTSAYSWILKEYVLLDVLMLSILYTLRIFAGSVAIDVPISSWLFAFSIFIFFSLALVKRCAELVSLDQSGRAEARGRDYRVTDLTILWPLGVGAALCSLVIFGLFITSAETQSRYANAQMLWFMVPGLIYWVSRLWIKTSRGEMHDDPIVFAIKDRASLLTMLYLVATILAAYFLNLSFI